MVGAPPKSRVWKLDSSITHQSGAGGWSGPPTSSRSSSGRPMFPASATRCPPLRRMCAINAVTVLLPLVPVTQIVRASGCSANHSAVPEVKRTPARCAGAAGGLYGLMPGDLMTKSNCVSVSASAAVVINRNRASAPFRKPSRAFNASASAALQKTASGLSGKRRRSAASAARPSRPKPQIATRGVGEIGESQAHDRRIAFTNMLSRAHATDPATAQAESAWRPAAAAPPARDRRARAAAGFLGKARDERVLPPFRPLRQREHRGARLASFADAFERLVFAVFEQRIESRRQRCIIEQVAAEDREQARLGHERRQREEHEVAFRTLPAPAIGGPFAADAEIAVAAGEHIVVQRAARKFARHGQFGPRPQQREIIQIGSNVRLCILTQAPLEFQALAPLVIDLLAIVFQRRGGSRLFVGKNDRVVAVQDRRANQNRRVDRRDRNMAVPRAKPVVLEQFRRELALDVQHGQSGARRACRNQFGTRRPTPPSWARARSSAFPR